MRHRELGGFNQTFHSGCGSVNPPRFASHPDSGNRRQAAWKGRSGCDQNAPAYARLRAGRRFPRLPANHGRYQRISARDGSGAGLMRLDERNRATISFQDRYRSAKAYRLQPEAADYENGQRRATASGPLTCCSGLKGVHVHGKFHSVTTIMF